MKTTGAIGLHSKPIANKEFLWFTIVGYGLARTAHTRSEGLPIPQAFFRALMRYGQARTLLQHATPFFTGNSPSRGILYNWQPDRRNHPKLTRQY